MVDYARMNQRLYAGDHEGVAEMVEQALAAGHRPAEVLREGLLAGMNAVGEDFRQNRIFVPEVLLAARAMKAGMAVLRPLLAGSEPARRSRTVVLGTVAGDVHDIGKNLVGMLAEGAGFEVVDLGVDQDAARFVRAAVDHGADLVGMSALLTTTMVYMPKVIAALREAGLGSVKVCVGGAPVGERFAREIGADGYAGDAASAVDLFRRLVPA